MSNLKNKKMPAWKQEYLELVDAHYWKEDKIDKVYYDAIEISLSFIEKLIKAFGGCTRCWGKGYGTSNEDQYVMGDFHGEKSIHHKGIQMIFCDCSRGQQLKKLLKNK